MMFAIRRGTIPDFRGSQSDDVQYDGTGATSRETMVQKAGPERLVLLPKEDQDFIVPGDYYIAVVSEGVNPPNNNTIGTGNSSGVLTSHGPLATANPSTVTVAGTTTPVTLAGGQVKAYQFTVSAGTHALEVRLDNRVGNPWLNLISGIRLPLRLQLLPWIRPQRRPG